MAQPQEFYVSTSEAQANISKMIKFMENERDRFIVTRYSKPIGVFLPFGDYQRLKQMARHSKGGACLSCNL